MLFANLEGEPELTFEADQNSSQLLSANEKVESEEMITVTPRQLEGIIRLSICKSKMFNGSIGRTC